MSGMPPPADPSRTSIFSAVDLTEEREEAEVAAEMERKARESAENIRRMLDARDHLVSDGPTRRRSMPTGSLWGRLRETVAAASAAAAAEGGSGVSRKATPEAGDPPLDPMEC